jgi:hypothetical protein
VYNGGSYFCLVDPSVPAPLLLIITLASLKLQDAALILVAQARTAVITEALVKYLISTAARVRVLSRNNKERAIWLLEA